MKNTKTVKRLLALCLAAVLALSFAGCGTGGSKVAVIGISQYAEHPSLDNCRTGFLQGLKDAGLEEGKDYTIEYQNAGADNNIATQIAQNFSSKNVTLMCAIATPAATACFAAAEDKNIPVVFNAITDPKQANLTEGNITGVSDKLPIDPQLALIRKIQPEAKTIGIVYTTSEPNSVSAIAEYQQKAGSYGFTIDAVGVTSEAEVTQAVDTLINHKVDCLSNLTDNNVVNVLASVLEKTNDAKIPVYGSEVEQVKKGCVASAGIDYVALGKMAGLQAAKILKGEAKASDMPYETVSEYNTYINSDALAAMNLTVPADVAEKAIESK